MIQHLLILGALALCVAAIVIETRTLKLIAGALALFFLASLLSGCVSGTVSTPYGDVTVKQPPAIHDGKTML